MVTSARLAFLLLLLAASAFCLGNTWTDADVAEMKRKYEPKAAPAAPGPAPPRPVPLPRELLEAPYRRPSLVQWLLPYQEWEAEYRTHFQRLYRDPALTFRPTMIVMHYTVTADAGSVWAGFARGCQMSQGDYGNNFGHPSVHLMVDTDGTVLQLLPLDRRCTGAYGVDHVALSIEMVARNEAELLGRRGQVRSSFHLVKWLMQEFSIPESRVIAHYEVSQGVSVVPDYTDFADSACPDRYPPASARSDPGPTYMAWLRTWLREAR